MHATSRRYHGATADAAAIIPQLNYPPHIRHRLGSPFDENYASEFYGEIEITVAGQYNFSLLCSDDCQFRLKMNRTTTSWSGTRVLYIGGPQVPDEQAVAPLMLDVGFYEILLSHAVSKNDTGSDADLRNNLGPACVLYWATPQYAPCRVTPLFYQARTCPCVRAHIFEYVGRIRYTKREIPAWALSHRAPTIATSSDSYLYSVVGGGAIDAELGSPTTRSVAGVDASWCDLTPLLPVARALSLPPLSVSLSLF
jgi:hypothetical protein